MAEETNEETKSEAASEQEAMPAIFEQVFGKRAEAPKQEPAKEPEPVKTEVQPEQPATEPPKPTRANLRFQKLLEKNKEYEAKIREFEAKKGEASNPQADLEKMFAERQLEETQAELAEAAQERLAEAFPDEKARREFVELSEDFAPVIDKYAPKAADLICGSPISYQLANAFYDVLSRSPNAMKDFLSMPFAVQKKELQGLEAFLQNGGKLPNGTSTTTPAPAEVSVPKPLTPSESGGQASGENNAYASTIERIKAENRGK